jgi:hypothetical protein
LKLLSSKHEQLLIDLDVCEQNRRKEKNLKEEYISKSLDLHKLLETQDEKVTFGLDLVKIMQKELDALEKKLGLSIRNFDLLEVEKKSLGLQS